MQEIISSKPDFLEKRPIEIFILLFVVCIFSLSLIRFKSSIELNGTLRAKEHVAEIISDVDGTIRWLPKIKDGNIKEGQLIASFVDSVPFEHVRLLKDRLDSIIHFIQNNGHDNRLQLPFNLPPMPSDLHFNFNYSNIDRLRKKKLNRSSSAGNDIRDGASMEPDSVLLNKVSFLNCQLEKWLKRHAIFSPTHGRIRLIQPLYLGQNVTIDSSLGYIDPRSKIMYAESHLALDSYQKVRLGQQVHFHLHDFPELKADDLLGKVTYISPIKKNNGYLIIIGFTSSDKNSLIAKLTDGTPVNLTIELNNTLLINKLYYSISKYISSL